MKRLATFTCLLLTSCAHLTPSERVVRDMLVAGAIGAAIGQQSSKNQDLNSMAYGGLAASSAAMIGLIVHDPEQVPRRVESENLLLRRELEEARESRVESHAPGTLSAYIPERYRKLVRPGEWKVMEIDEWLEDGENRLVHRDKVIELIPPTLRPVSR